jgi:alkylation response protein AidB-like acyl-CoA dehydrogenase
MDFALSAEQVALADSERTWLSRHDPILLRRATIDSGPAPIDPQALRHVNESGFTELLSADMGGDYTDLGVLVEEHGRAASSVPLAEIVLANSTVENGAPSLSALLINTSADASTVPLVIGSAEDVPLVAEVSGSTLRISGHSAPSPGLIDAVGFVIAATTGDGHEVVAYVAADRPGTVVKGLETLDLTRGWARLEFDIELDSEFWTTAPEGTAAVAVDALATYSKFDALGAAARLVDMTVEYAKQRTQFDRPIAGFQAVKHHCANMALQVEASRATLWAATVALNAGDVDRRRRAVSSAAAFTGEATSTVAALALQVHGGIGFTWEHDLHLLTRRIKVDELLNGSVSRHRRRLITS